MKNSSSPLYKGTLICGEDLTISFQKKRSLKLSQCWAIGFSILEVSKVIMQRLYYEEILPSLGPRNVSVVMSDTDSFLLSIRGCDELEAMIRLAHVMDFSNLDKNHPLYNTARCKLPGFLKNEVPLALILEAVGLKAKTYALRCSNNKVLNKAKGVIEAIKDMLGMETYLKCINFIASHEVVQNTLRSINHINQMLRSKKVAFTSFDDKRFLLCPIHSAPYGSVLCKNECFFCLNPHEMC